MAKRRITEKNLHPLADAEEAVKPLKAKYGLEVAQRNTSKYGEELVLQNEVAGVKIRHSPRDGEGLHVLVGRLVDGRFPPHPGSFDEQTELHRFDLRDIASACPEGLPSSLYAKIEKDTPIDAADVAALLAKCCGNLLAGNFSLFRTLSPLVKQRAARLALESRR